MFSDEFEDEEELEINLDELEDGEELENNLDTN